MWLWIYRVQEARLRYLIMRMGQFLKNCAISIISKIGVQATRDWRTGQQISKAKSASLLFQNKVL
jgi:hypothetical protein